MKHVAFALILFALAGCSHFKRPKLEERPPIQGGGYSEPDSTIRWKPTNRNRLKSRSTNDTTKPDDAAADPVRLRFVARLYCSTEPASTIVLRPVPADELPADFPNYELDRLSRRRRTR